VLRGELGRLLAAAAAFEFGNVAATLLILRATQLLIPGHGAKAATTISRPLHALQHRRHTRFGARRTSR
jgi:hypothetical protein